MIYFWYSNIMNLCLSGTFLDICFVVLSTPLVTMCAAPAAPRQKRTPYTKVYCERDCSVCVEELTTDVVVTPCGHLYHQHCLDQWLVKSDTCPICANLFFAEGLP